MTYHPASGSTLALAPGTASTAPGTGANTEPRQLRLPTSTHRLPPSRITRRPLLATDTALDRAGDGYFDWLDHVWPAAGCTHPIRLFGDLDTVDTRTGEITRTLPTTAMPDGVIYKACGNRRATVCPSCADTYRRDAFHLIRSGLAGGKTVPTTVTRHPAVFATLTAPSFGPVHARHVRRHTCTDKTRCSCRPDPCHARRERTHCPHGQLVACFARHGPRDDRLGQPLCPDCYDHDHHVIWNNHAGELWRRTKQAITRRLNQLARQRGLAPVRVSHGKVAEFQARGAVHFHALLRLDGIDPDDPTLIVPPPSGITAADLDDAIRYAAAHIAYTTDPHPAWPGGWPITWGEQVDVRIISLHGESVSDAMVAGYLAKYATKGTEITGHTSRRLHTHNIALYANPGGTHTERLVHAAWTLGDHPGFESLRRWAHMLGFGGHFLTKARHYSLTFAALRAARLHYRRTQPQGPDYSDERIQRQDDLDAETTIVLARLSYVGTGWKTTGDALLANTAADQARRRHQAGREELAHELAAERPLAA
ncbi:replication initiator [Actinomadura sp. 9N215]|uniref:replication initiator n=1 Tax=Actinomadura sp. 9N215 TaxID=3375150 RepID=UPI0037A87F0D